MVYLYAKAVHIIFVVCWMAGLFYIVRLFIYHTEAKSKSEGEYGVLHKQFIVMESKLWWIITTPAMYLTIIAALIMLYINPGLLTMGWMHVKLTFVLGLMLYHFSCQRIMFQLKDESSKWSSTKLRLWNELATVLLFAIVFTVVLKSALNWIFGVLGLLILAVSLMMAVKLYKKFRNKKAS
ncbi:protoporphyrinogen oxidase HemJ [Sphingobacterium sp. N143]|uniref:protoporphyrinogen oxidase HemJ n=1 Tax=Sphingobacterium sp. N143 TaxID=2746727 RepID=UPI002577FA66|nr:protoporphyrinogen oxidase HemJ [Sphingobacterium sp. N143]MDM1294762.1 protoporphyrinogen oxidase HemJ [Sphingobacterium sp. N143]